jgi:hypothetical protein
VVQPALGLPGDRDHGGGLAVLAALQGDAAGGLGTAAELLRAQPRPVALSSRARRVLARARSRSASSSTLGTRTGCSASIINKRSTRSASRWRAFGSRSDLIGPFADVELDVDPHRDFVDRFRFNRIAQRARRRNFR